VDESSSRTIRFPRGRWTSLWSGAVVSGPATFKLAVPWDRIPVYLKSGAAAPVQLNAALQFGASLSTGCVHALLVTPPQDGETVTLHPAQGDAKMILRPAQHGFVLALRNLPETEYLLIYGASVSEVRVDGKILPRLDPDGRRFATSPDSHRQDRRSSFASAAPTSASTFHPLEKPDGPNFVSLPPGWCRDPNPELNRTVVRLSPNPAGQGGAVTEIAVTVAERERATPRSGVR
jgi:hypothetical protein